MRAISAAVMLFLAGCQAAPEPGDTGARGHLLAIGGGLDDDSRAVYERLLALASRSGPPRIVVVTAATGDQEQEVVDKGESLRVWRPDVAVEFLRRETPTAEAVALIDRATALFFTGGDQQRITDRYRPAGTDSPERAAMLRLLARGGVIAGASAGDAMLGEHMLLSGRSAPALGIAGANAPASETEAEPTGPRVGPGMGLVPWLFTDSHFFERDRIGRLVAALEATGQPLGIGVGEDGCVEIDLGARELIGIAPSESLLVDVRGLRRDGLRRTGLHALRVQPGTRIDIDEQLRRAPPAVPEPTSPMRPVPVVEAGQNRQLASWRLFAAASVPGSGRHVLQLDGWQVTAWPDGAGGVCFSVGPR
jgi:cyanophycinase